MGKRKERRLAAKSNAGRRVKLDLFAEPSGDLGGSSAKDKVDEIGDSEHVNGLPKSPSSSDCEVAMVWDIQCQIRSGPFYSEILIDSISHALFPEPWLCGDEGRILIGQQLVNSLLFLGQYSDDETEDGSGKSSHDDPGKSFLVDSKDQVAESSGPRETCDTVEVYPDSDLDQQKVGELEGIDSICMDDPHKLGGADAKDDDLTVLKEADLGEPSLLPSGSEAQVVGDVNSGWKLVMHEESGQYYYWNTETGETSWEAPAVFLQTAQPSAQEYSAPQYNGVESNPDSTYTIDVMHNCSFPGDALLESKESVGVGFHTQRLFGGYHKCVHCGRDVDKEVKDYEAENNSWADTLISLIEHLVERLKSLQSANGVLHGEDWIANYILELEIRRSDFESLSSCGSSLHPFWLHSEAQLRRLELAINGQIYKTDKFNSSVQVEDANKNLPTGTVKLECGETELIEENRGKEASPDMENGSCENLTGKAGVTAETGCYEVLNDDKGSDSSSKQSGIGLEEGELIDNVGHPNSSGPTSSQDGEDIDMDVDMDVEDAVSVGGVVPPPPERPVTTEGFFTMPPPPDDEWIPPPPPETEQIPPPPPDEPPEPSYPAMTYTGVGQPFTYADYTVPYNYIHGDMAGSNFYVHAEGGQVVQPDVSILYGAVPGIYGDAAHISVYSVGPIVYYSLQDGAVPSVDGVIPVESTQVHLHSRPSSNSSLLTDQAGSSHAIPEVSSKSSLGNSSFSGKTENKDSDPLSTSLTGTSTSTIGRESMMASLGNRGVATITVNALATSTDTKKVSRSKKRAKAVTPTLRSNKKVSSLVDKWKAAKDELQEEEEEEEAEDEAKIALSILEKKRQREIEEWRAQQFASGEAKDNVNFQPLDGDWRARVKRKRAQTVGKVVATNEPETTGNQQVDLAEISRQLPSGWQAYWDESSKQVYYGNKITSETSWTKPTT